MKKDDEITDKSLKFYLSTMDSLHFYLYHLFDVGLRVKSDTGNHTLTTNTDKEVLNAFSRYNNNSKFTITASTNTNQVFSDAMRVFLVKNKISQNIITHLHEYIEKEEFDTDTIQIDTEINGNIAIQIQDKKVLTLIQQFIRSHKCMFIQYISFPL